jgi:hypothetical protein
MKNTPALHPPKNYKPHTCASRTGLLLGRAVSDYVDKYKGTSDAYDLIIIARSLFRDGYTIAKAEKRFYAEYMSKKKGQKQ